MKAKAYLIDPISRTVREVEYDGQLHSIYTLLDCELIDSVWLNKQGDVCFVDDEGLLRDDAEERGFFTIDGSQPLAGRGLVSGTSMTGEEKSPAISLDACADMVRFFTADELGGVPEPHIEFVPFDDEDEEI